jgi:hypothetical protein
MTSMLRVSAVCALAIATFQSLAYGQGDDTTGIMPWLGYVCTSCGESCLSRWSKQPAFRVGPSNLPNLP